MDFIKSLRLGNRALDYLISRYEPMSVETKRLVETLPNIAAQLNNEADNGAKNLMSSQSASVVGRFFRRITGSAKQQSLLARCLVDVMLTVYFDEVLAYSGDKELSSLLVDSLLYQATGCESSSPTESDILDGGTQNARGIHKFVMGRKLMPHIGDMTAWLFGKEVAALDGKPNEIGIILSVAPFSIMVRGHAKWTTRHFLYGSSPTEAEQLAFETLLTEQNQKLFDMVKQFNQ
jgi:hypothetical protein